MGIEIDYFPGSSNLGDTLFRDTGAKRRSAGAVLRLVFAILMSARCRGRAARQNQSLRARRLLLRRQGIVVGFSGWQDKRRWREAEQLQRLRGIKHVVAAVL